MVVRSARLVAVYVLGILLVGGWSLSHVFAGSVTSENAAGVIVFPLAWTFGFWPTVVPLFLAHRVWRLQATLEDYCARRASGVSTAEPEAELEDTITLLAAEENGIPERLVRPFVRRFLRSAQRAASGS
jgi:hypothetical protein